ncbi:MAG: IclR family transcriptional regulator, partial [Desulfobacula sp.]|nr:IclR family transcriptional regulator [Desulfobacula sp.]
MTDFLSTPYLYNKSVGKGLKIIELLSDHGGLTDTEIAKRLKYNLITVQQLLLIYQQSGYITRDNENLYDLSIKIFDISRKFKQRSEIKDIAHSHLSRIAKKYNETTTLGTVENTSIIYLDKIDSMELLRFAPQAEQRITAHHTALGKSILAHLPVKEINRYCHRAPWRPLTPKTIDSKTKLLIRLQQIRHQGFAICDEEHCLGLRGIAVAILDALNYPRFSISIWGPTSRMRPDILRKMQIDLTHASIEISKYYTADYIQKPYDFKPLYLDMEQRKSKMPKKK